MDLIQKNKDMLLAGKYNIQDTRQLSRIASLTNPNDYDLYLIACALCNYDIPEKAEARDLRMQLFLKTKDSNEDYTHKESDYGKIETKLKCTNTGKTNKYGLYEYEINVNDRDLVSDLWGFKDKDCLKYVDNKTYGDKLIISIGKNQLDNFKAMLNKLGIAYNNSDVNTGIVFTNKSTHKLIDINTLNLPFKPYDFQIEDAEKILKTKRALLGHEMGCVSGKSKVNIQISAPCEQIDVCKAITIEELFNIFKTNKNIKIESFTSRGFEFKSIANVLDKGIKDTIRILVNDTFIECTTDHPICTPKGWINAEDLSVGDIIVTKKGNRKITSILLADTQHVYDIVIDDIIVHNFVCNDIVVHNCGKTFISVLIGTSIGHNTKVVYKDLDNLDYNNIIITDKGPLPIGKIVEENIDCKVKIIKNGEPMFVNIIDRKCVDDNM